MAVAEAVTVEGHHDASPASDIGLLYTIDACEQAAADLEAVRRQLEYECRSDIA